MAFKLNRSSKEPMSEINVTPFVDVRLVLFRIFMVTAPFIGLFGTVWGIMNSFQSIAISRNTSLATVSYTHLTLPTISDV